MIPDLIRALFGDMVFSGLSFVFYLYPIWLPIILAVVFWDVWVHYVRNSYFHSIKYSLLEIKLPLEVNKSPQAMEIIIDSLWEGAGAKTFINRYWEGKTRPWYSLELVSIGGNVKFFIWTRSDIKDYIEARIYSQYPGVEVYEVPDYTKMVDFDPNKNKMTGCNFVLVKPSPYPIKTYVDFGLDKDPKEEFKIDPITPMLEYLGSLGPGEQLWYQIVIRAHKSEIPIPNSGPDIGIDFKKSPIGVYFDHKKISIGKKKDWTADATEAIEEIREGLKDKDNPLAFPRIMTKGEAETIAAMERNVGKPPFDVGIRAIYIADKESFIGARKTGVYGAFRHLNGLNGLKPESITSFDNPWQEWSGNRLNIKKKALISAYKNRGFFYAPFNTKDVFVMNSEALATIFHFPGAVATTPTFTRIPSKKSEAPANLPI